MLLAAIAALSFLIAFLFSNLGLGGGLLYVPVLILLGSLAYPEARPVSLAAATATSIAAAWNHHRAGKLAPAKGLVAMAGTIIGVVVGVFAIRVVPDDVMEIGFGLFLVGVSVKIYLDLDKRDRAVFLGNWMVPAAALLAFCSGLISIALAVGGGLLLVPLFVYVMNVEPRAAVGTSSMVAAVNTAAGFAVLLSFPSPGTSFDWAAIAVLAAVALVGSFAGSRWGLKNLKTKTVYVLVIVVMVAAAGAMLARGLGFI
jgi:hypothetical protein